MPDIGMPYEAKKGQGCCYNEHICVSNYGTFLFWETRKLDFFRLDICHKKFYVTC